MWCFWFASRLLTYPPSKLNKETKWGVLPVWWSMPCWITAALLKQLHIGHSKDVRSQLGKPESFHIAAFPYFHINVAAHRNISSSSHTLNYIFQLAKWPFFISSLHKSCLGWERKQCSVAFFWIYILSVFDFLCCLFNLFCLTQVSPLPWFWAEVVLRPAGFITTFGIDYSP